MGDYNLSLEIKQVGAEKALDDFTTLSKAGQMVVERFAKATGTAIDQAVAHYKRLGDSASMEMLRVAVAAEEAAKGQAAMGDAVEKSTKAIEHGTASHEPHIRGLSRIGYTLSTLIGHATGLPPVFEKIGDTLAVFTFGHLASVGVLAGFAAVAVAYEKMGEKAREAAKEMDKSVASLVEWKKEQDLGPGGKFVETVEQSEQRLEMQRKHLADLKAILDRPATPQVAGEGVDQSAAFAESERANIQERYDRLAKAVEAGEAHVRELRQKAGEQTVADQVHNLAAVISAQQAGAGEIRNAAALVDGLRASLNGLANDGSQNAKRAEIIAQIKELTDALDEGAKRGTVAFEKWVTLQERRIKGLSLSGELSATQIGQLKDEADHWRALAAAMGPANREYEKYMQLAKSDDELIQKQRDLSYSGSRAASAFAKDFGSPTVVTPGASARMGLIADLLPDPKELAAQLRYTIGLAVAAVKDSPAVQWTETAKQLGDDMGKRLGQGLGQGLTAGFAAAFSGKGVIGFIEGFGDSMLAALGDIFIRQGEALISFSLIMKGLGIALANPITAPFAAAAEGVALIALGSALAAAAHGGGGSSGGGAGAGGGGGPFTTPSYLTFGVQAQSTPTTSLAAPPSRPTMVFNVIGNDPKVQRDIAAIVNSATDRGLIGGGRG